MIMYLFLYSNQKKTKKVKCFLVLILSVVEFNDKLFINFWIKFTSFWSS